MNCSLCESLLVDALYDELSRSRKNEFNQHIGSCPGCADTFARMRSTLDIMDNRKRPEPGQAYWDGFYNRVTARMEREEEHKQNQGWLGRILPGLSVTGTRWAYRGVLAVVLIVFGAVVGRVVLPGQEIGTGTEVVEVDNTPGTNIPGMQVKPVASAEACARQYIEDSQVLLLALVNFDPETEGEYMADWTGQKKRSRELLNQASSLKNELDDPKQRRLRRLVTELELILIQIANLETTGDLDAVDLIRSSVSDRDVMIKIHMEQLRGGDVKEPDPGTCDA